MRITRVTLENVYQHEALDIPITGSSVAIVGDNGSGKSNFLAAIGEAIHGDFHKTVDKTVMWGKKKGRIVVEATLPGSRFMKISRGFPGSDCSLFISFPGGDDLVTGVSKVNARILQELGVDKKTLKSLVFVGQQEIDSILFSTDSVKGRLAQQFFGLSKAAELEAIMSKSLSTVTIDSMSESIDDLRERKKALLVRKNEISRSIDSLAPRSDIQAEIDAATEWCRYYRERDQILQAIKYDTESLESRRVGYQSKYEEHRDLTKKVSLVNIGEVDTTCALIQSKLAIMNSINECEPLVSEYQTELDSIDVEGINTDRLTLESKRKRVSEICNEIYSLRGSIIDARSVVDAVSDKSTCPTCHQPIDSSHVERCWEKITQVDQSISQLTGEQNALENEIRSLSAKIDRITSRVTFLELNLRSLKDRLADLNGKLVSLSDVHVEQEQHWKSVQSEYTRDRSRLDFLATEMHKEHPLLEQISKRISDSRVRLDQIQISGLYSSLDEANAKIEQLRNDIAKIDQVATVLYEIDSQVNYMDIQIAKAEQAKVLNAVNLKCAEIFAEVKSVFHPSGAPEIVVTRSTQALEGRINSYLKMMRSKFVVRATRGLNFECIFDNGVGEDTSLSVGQKVALSWAFRLAACETFSSSAGIMTMDEPTAALDKNVNDAFLDVMDSIRTLCSDFGMQFFIATHHESIANQADQVIQV